MGHVYLVVGDVHSHWPEIQIMENITTDVSMDALTELFRCYGICDSLASDNSTTFVSKTFQKFLKVNGIAHKTTNACRTSADDLAEKMIQSFKASLIAHKHNPGIIRQQFANRNVNRNATSTEEIVRHSFCLGGEVLDPDYRKRHEK